MKLPILLLYFNVHIKISSPLHDAFNDLLIYGLLYRIGFISRDAKGFKKKALRTVNIRPPARFGSGIFKCMQRVTRQINRFSCIDLNKGRICTSAIF